MSGHTPQARRKANGPWRNCRPQLVWTLLLIAFSVVAYHLQWRYSVDRARESGSLRVTFEYCGLTLVQKHQETDISRWVVSTVGKPASLTWDRQSGRQRGFFRSIIRYRSSEVEERTEAILRKIRLLPASEQVQALNDYHKLLDVPSPAVSLLRDDRDAYERARRRYQAAQLELWDMAFGSPRYVVQEGTPHL